MLPLLDWNRLTESERAAALQRPANAVQGAVFATAQTLIDRVRSGGDGAARDITRELDGVALDSLRVSPAEVNSANADLPAAARTALDRAIANVRCFHAAQLPAALAIETLPGVLCERRSVPLNKVGLYVPAGSAPLPSTAIMLGVPAQIAGCPLRVLCTPPRPDGRADPATLHVARQCGIEHIYKIGGAQAIAAMAYGTESIPKTDKVFGPGNVWVTAAKLLVSRDPGGAACDLPAGPSEVLVIADETARADFVAADLLAQAEHSPDAQAVLVTTSAALARETSTQVEAQMQRLSRREILRRSLASARIILVDDLATAIAVSNAYAPEHLILQVRQPRQWLEQVRCAGSVFLGPWSPEPMGDYCTGTNHVLPTGGYARAYSGLSLMDFLRHLTVQELTQAGLADLGPTAQTLANLEGLDAHASAVAIRLKALAERGVA
ncbi:MAG TPA: histidinol dehydrogenase [Steroidobacteraceae bacterium]|nr:histidinol dehydrogenase [Steroidobacteraceae bacterium]